MVSANFVPLCQFQKFFTFSLDRMKPRLRTPVSMVLVIVTFLVLLPCLFFYYNPSTWCGIACLISRNSSNDRNDLVAESFLNSSSQLSLNQTNLAPSSDAASETNLETSTDAANETSSDAASETNQLVAASPDGDADADARRSQVPELEAVLRGAATRDKTVIITTLNQAWAAPGSMIDVFLESFRKGEGTAKLLQYVVVVALDQQSWLRCRELLLQHRGQWHCFMVRTPGVDFSGSKQFMSKDFLKMMWRRMSLLRTILELGYNFVFTDADILWLRDPFEHFVEKADFQISLDMNPKSPRSRAKPNCGFQYGRSNNRTIAMYQHWCHVGDEDPHVDEQTVLTRMLGANAFAPSKVQISFLPTESFSGFCQKSKNMSRVVTMHANCCTNLDNKVHDLKKALSVWEAAKSRSFVVNSTSGVNSTSEINSTSEVDLWHVPDACRRSTWPRSPPPPPILEGIAT